jgi:hypothetical protein
MCFLNLISNCINTSGYVVNLVLKVNVFKSVDENLLSMVWGECKVDSKNIRNIFTSVFAKLFYIDFLKNFTTKHQTLLKLN